MSPLFWIRFFELQEKHKAYVAGVRRRTWARWSVTESNVGLKSESDADSEFGSVTPVGVELWLWLQIRNIGVRTRVRLRVGIGVGSSVGVRTVLLAADVVRVESASVRTDCLAHARADRLDHALMDERADE